MSCKHLFPCPDGHFQPVFKGWKWTEPALVVSTVRVISIVEIDQKPIAFQRHWFQVMPGAVSFLDNGNTIFHINGQSCTILSARKREDMSYGCIII